MAEGCVFCRMMRGELPASVVFEDGTSVAILDHRPVFPGHTLLFPREHHETLPDLPANLVGPLFRTAQRLALAVQAALQADGTLVLMNNHVSQSVPHLHVHVIPRQRGDGLRGFLWPRRTYPDAAEEERVRDAIRAAMAGLPPA